ncbi:MAG: DNA repair protein RadA [Candidatus Daviesbacteria bacterium]|nr:DNA repair protein RadA [Candidatus Daviesbacteria bacterium]
MTKFSSVYICQQCGFKASQFLGKCPECGTWNSLVETVEESSARQLQGRQSSVKRATMQRATIINLSEIEKQHYPRISTNLEEFDRCLGGGIVPGSVVLVSGDPGVGKSTLLLQMALGLNYSVGVGFSDPNVKGGKTPPLQSNVLYIAGEESAQQIKIRADRIDPKASLAILNETDVDIIGEVIRGSKDSKESWGLVIIDSIQTMETMDLSGVAGSVGQVRECSHRLQKLAKSLHIPIFIVGHITKDGSIAGPKTLEHLVDVVLSLEGESTSNFRILRATKNRFGSTDEIGIFEMGEKGMMEVQNPSKIFLEEKVNAPGSAVVATLNGMRPILVEIQALVTKSFLPIPKRVGSGIDNNRLQLLVAVLQSRMKLPVFDKDIFVNVTGGLKVIEPACDLGICMAIISSLKDQEISNKTVLVGEVGLLGEVRGVRGIDKRSAEAKKLGFTKVISSENAKNLTEAIRLACGLPREALR